MFGSLASGAKALGLRFTFSGVLPFSLLALFAVGLAVVARARPGESLFTALGRAGREAGPAGALLIVLAAVTFAVVTQPFQIGFVRLLEGYWGISRPARHARAIGVELQRRRVHLLRQAIFEASLAGEDEIVIALSGRISRYPREARHRMPTLLGNTLRASERRSGERYGMDTIRTWPRLYHVLPESFHREVGELHGQVDGGSRLSVALGLAGVFALPVLATHGWWNLLTAATLILSWVAYRGAVAAAAILSTVLAAAYDLHRFDLLEALHLPLPRNMVEERTRNTALSAFLTDLKNVPKPLPFNYCHANNGPKRLSSKVQGSAQGE